MPDHSEKKSFEVLIVDDDPVVSLLHKNQLKVTMMPLPPLLFRNGRTALDFLKKKDSEENNFLILLDIHMPVLNGWEFLTALKNENLSSGIFVILVTSSINKEDHIRSKEFKHVIGFCRKPLLADQLRQIMQLKEVHTLFSGFRKASMREGELRK